MPRDYRSYISVLVFLLICPAQLHAQDGKPLFSSSAGYVIASGKWKSTSGSKGDELLFKHAIEIHCRSDVKLCMEANAQIIGQEPQASLFEYSVIEWDKNGIIAEDNSSICMTNRLLINFQDKEVMAVDTPKKDAKGMPLGNGKNACQIVDHTQTYKLVSQWK